MRASFLPLFPLALLCKLCAAIVLSSTCRTQHSREGRRGAVESVVEKEQEREREREARTSRGERHHHIDASSRP